MNLQHIMSHCTAIDHIYLPTWFEVLDLTSSQILTKETILSVSILTSALCGLYDLMLRVLPNETHLAVLNEGVGSVFFFSCTESHCKGSDVCPCCGQRSRSWTSGEYESKISIPVYVCNL